MKGTKYLSELVDCSAFQKGKLNVIKAPTGSGKTFFALKHIPSLTRDTVHEVVYLIDTINGKEQILKQYGAIPDYPRWGEEVAEACWFVETENVVVITYAKFGILCDRYPEFYKNFSYIICDELPSLFKFQNFSPRPNAHSVSREKIEFAVKYSEAIVIALTATPDTIKTQFRAPSFEILIDQKELIQYEIKRVEGYTTLDAVLSEVATDAVGLCYLTRISQMLLFEEDAKEAGLSPICIWSTQNKDHPMTEEQLEARRSILEEFTIPPKYNLLIINSSSETSLKIKSRVDYVIVQSTNPDTQVQVRGRVNSDLEALYLPFQSVPTITVPPEFLGKRLFTEEKRQLCSTLDIRNQNNRPYAWAKIKEFLIDADYTVSEGRHQDHRYVIIYPAPDG